MAERACKVADLEAHRADARCIRHAVSIRTNADLHATQECIATAIVSHNIRCDNAHCRQKKISSSPFANSGEERDQLTELTIVEVAELFVVGLVDTGIHLIEEPQSCLGGWRA